MSTRKGIVRKASVAACLLASASLVVVGCSADKKAEEGSKETKGTESSAPATQGEKMEGEAVQIEYWHRLPDKDGMVKVEEIVKRWNAEHPEIQVTATKFEGKADESYAKIGQAVKAGNAPCLAQVGYGEIGSQFIAGNLMDVTQHAKQYEGNYAAGPFGQSKVGEMIVGLPQDTGPLVYYYNKDAFKELGIEVPTTWDDYKAAAAKAKAAGKYIGVYQPDEQQYLLSGMAASAGAKWFGTEGESWVVSIDTPETKKVIDTWQALLDEELVLSANRWSDEWDSALAEGKIIGWVGAGWEAGFAFEKQPGTNWGVAQIPQFDAAKPATGADGGSAVAVINGCAHPAEAVQFADWFNTQIDDLLSQGLLPAATGELSTPDAIKAKFGGDDVYKTIAEANAIMAPDFTYSPTWPVVGAKINEVSGKVLTKQAKLEDVVKSAQEIAVSSLKDAGLTVK